MANELTTWLVWSAAGLLFCSTGTFAEDAKTATSPGATATGEQKPAAAAQEKKDEKGAPLPLHSIEGTGGILVTQMAYLVNPPSKGNIAGLPAIEGAFVSLGNDRYLTALTVTENLAGRVELGYAWQRFDLGDLQHDIKDATGLKVRDGVVNQHNFNVRGLLVKDGEPGASWTPAVTIGLQFKYNADIDDIDHDLGKTLTHIGITDNQGVDFTLYATKMIKQLGRPLLVSAGVRASKAAQTGLLGFTDDYQVTAEANLALFVTDHFILAGEFRQKTSEYQAIPGLISHENNWWTVDAAYIINKRCTVAGGYGHFGEVLNHKANGVWGLKVKWEF